MTLERESHTSDVRCIKCGYDIRGLEHTSCCPECGTSISLSNRYGPLDRADPLFIQTCSIGVTLLAVVIVIEVLQSLPYLTGAGFAMFSEYAEEVYWYFSRNYGSMRAIAIWILLSPEWYGSVAIDRTLRSRIVQIVGTFSALNFTFVATLANSLTIPLLVGGMFAILSSVLVYLRLRDLARRAQSPLVVQASIVLAMTIVAIAIQDLMPGLMNTFSPRRLPEIPLLLNVILGPGVAIYTVMFCWKFRRMLVNAAESARDNWPKNVEHRVADST